MSSYRLCRRETQEAFNVFERIHDMVQRLLHLLERLQMPSPSSVYWESIDEATMEWDRHAVQISVCWDYDAERLLLQCHHAQQPVLHRELEVADGQGEKDFLEALWNYNQEPPRGPFGEWNLEQAELVAILNEECVGAQQTGEES
jgi:hypothetical protein